MPKNEIDHAVVVTSKYKKRKDKQLDKITVTTKKYEKTETYCNTVDDIVSFYKHHIDFFIFPFLFPKEFEKQTKSNSDLEKLRTGLYDCCVEQIHKRNIESKQVMNIENMPRGIEPSFIYKSDYRRQYIDNQVVKLIKQYESALKSLKGSNEIGNADELKTFFIENDKFFEFINNNYQLISDLSAKLKNIFKIPEEQLKTLQEEVAKNSFLKAQNKQLYNLFHGKKRSTKFFPFETIANKDQETTADKDKKSAETAASQHPSTLFAKSETDELKTNYDPYLFPVIKSLKAREDVLDIIANDENIKKITDHFVLWLNANPKESSFLTRPVKGFLTEIFKACQNKDCANIIAKKFDSLDMKTYIKQMYPGNSDKQEELKTLINKLKACKSPAFR